jgi:hypothetical protein
MKDMMIDLETMSTHPSNAVVLSLAAIPFELFAAGPKHGPTLKRVLNINEQLMKGREVLASTQAFWMDQPEEARAHWFDARLQVQVAEVLCELADFVREHKPERIWANGIVFDIGNLETLFRQFGVPVPWKYNVPRDMRTVCREFPAINFQTNDGNTTGVLHDPESDCVDQIAALWSHWPSDLMTKPPAPIAQPAAPVMLGITDEGKICEDPPEFTRPIP